MRRVYYFTNANEIEVLSSTEGWQSPIKLPKTNSKTQLWGIGISPNSDVLAVSDIGNSLIYGIYLPSSPKEIVSLAPVGTAGLDKGQPQAATGLSPTNSGIVYYIAEGEYALHSLNLLTGANHTYTQTFGNGGSGEQYQRTEQSPDGGLVYFNYGGNLGILDVSTNAVNFPAALQIGQQEEETSLSADGSTLLSSDIFADAAGNPTGEITYVDYDTWAVSSVHGQKLNGDGSLLYQPLSGGLDVLDSQTGLLKARLSTSFSLASVFDALAIDGTTDGQVVAITGTGNGVAVMDLSSLSLVGLQPEIRKSNHQGDNVAIAVTGDQAPTRRSNTGPLHRRMHLHSADKTSSGSKYLFSVADKLPDDPK